MIVDSFLLASALAYVWGIFLPKPVLMDVKRVYERIAFGFAALALISAVYLKSWLLWLVLGGVYVLASILNYLGYSRWNVLWSDMVSDAAQMYMTAWDFAIAVACFMKVF